MKTPAWKSKKRQRLHTEIRILKDKLGGKSNGINGLKPLTPEQKAFCQLEIDIRSKEINKLRTGTRRQRAAGFASG